MRLRPLEEENPGTQPSCKGAVCSHQNTETINSSNWATGKQGKWLLMTPTIHHAVSTRFWRRHFPWCWRRSPKPHYMTVWGFCCLRSEKQAARYWACGTHVGLYSWHRAPCCTRPSLFPSTYFLLAWLSSEFSWWVWNARWDPESGAYYYNENYNYLFYLLLPHQWAPCCYKAHQRRASSILYRVFLFFKEQADFLQRTRDSG